MTLQEFLSTADADHDIALQQARDYTTTSGRFITSNTLRVYVVQFGLYGTLTDTAANVGHAARDKCLAIMDSLRAESDFNFINGSPMGEANKALMDALIAEIPEKQAELAQLKSVLINYCNQTSNPFTNVTLHDVLIARDACPTKPVTAQADSGFVTITTTAACEKHNPRLMALNPRTNKWQRINSFYGVADAGAYDAAVPPQFNGWELAVDDTYGVM